MTTSEYQVIGMTCSNCERHVREEVEQIAGVTGVEVSHETGRLIVKSTGATDGAHTTGTVSTGAADFDAAVLAAVDEAGYRAARSA